MTENYSMENAEIIRATDRAVQVDAPELDMPVWVPQSVIVDESEVWEQFDTGTLIVAGWFARRKGWI